MTTLIQIIGNENRRPILAKLREKSDAFCKKVSYEVKANDLLENKNYIVALSYFEKAGKLIEGYEKVANQRLELEVNDWAGSPDASEFFEEIEDYFEKAGKLTEGCEKIANAILETKCFTNALPYFQKIGKELEGCELIARKLCEKKSYGLAAVYFEKAGLKGAKIDCYEDSCNELEKLCDHASKIEEDDLDEIIDAKNLADNFCKKEISNYKEGKDERMTEKEFDTLLYGELD